MKRIVRRITRFLDRLHNLWRWFPIIWNDRDWDDYFIFEVLKFKLKNMSDSFERNDWYVGNEQDVKKMRTCIKLIELVQSSYYETEAYDHENVEEYLAKYENATLKVLTDKKYQIFPNENRNTVAMNVGLYKHQQAKRILFTMLERYIEHWWE
jgi:hypothetical protein